MAESLALVWDLIANDRASGTFAKVGAEAEGASAGVGKLLGGLSALAVGGAIAASVKAAADFQASMLLVQTQAGATAQEVADMSPKILALAGQVAQAPEALATSLYHVESTGLRGSAALDAVRVAAEGAKVGHADLEQTTNALTATIASGMLPATETYAQAMGQLNTIVGSGDMKMQDLNDALSSGLLVTVKQYGVNINDVGAALADFGDNNIRGADAATRLRMAVQAIAAPGMKAAGELARIGLTTQQLKDAMENHGLNAALQLLHDHLEKSGIAANQWGDLLTQAFTKKAGAGVVTLMGTFDRFEQKYTEVSKGANTFGDAWAATTKTASFQFGALKDNVEAIGITLGEKFLPPISAFVGWLNDTALPAVERLGTSISQAVQSPQFQSFLSNVESLGTAAWHAIQNFSSVLVDIGQTVLPPVLSAGGQLVKFFTDLPSQVQLAAAAFVVLRVAAAKGVFDPLISALGSVRGAFSNFRADVSATAGALEASGLPGKMATFSATMQTAAERGVGALKSAGSGLLGMLGGPWGVTIAGAGIAISQWTADVQQAKQATQDWANELVNGGISGAMDVHQKYLDQYGGQTPDWLGKTAEWLGLTTSMQEVQKQADQTRGAMSDLQRAQADVNTATSNYEYLAGQYGPNSAQARDAAGQLQQANWNLSHAQDAVNQGTQTHLQLLQQQSNMELTAVNSNLGAMASQAALDSAIATYNDHVKLGSKYTGNLTQDTAQLAQETIQTAQAVAQHAADQAKANGVQDTSIIYTNTLHDTLQKYADGLNGPVKKAVQDAADATHGATIKTGDFQDAVDKMGLHVGQAWPDGTKVVAGATAEQIQHLKDLGYAVTTLPGSDPNKPQTIFVRANTDGAMGDLNSFLARANQLGFVGAMWNVGAPIGQGPSNAPSKTQVGGNPIGLPPVNRATGGLITGPGNGTSDSIPAMLSNGEFVVNAKATADHFALLHAINSGAAKKFAQGGLVWQAGLAASVLANLNADLNAQQQARAVAASAGGSERWRPLVDQVLRMLGISLSADSGVLSMIQHESGGNPNAINLWDSNARAGHPSQGLMQTIPGTFARWRNPALPNNILDPLANIYAGVNYALHNYGLGMLMGGGNHAGGRYVGYAAGTNWVPSDQFALLHRGEAVIPASQNQGAPYVGAASRPAPLIGEAHFYDTTDVDLVLRQAEYRQRSGAFS